MAIGVRDITNLEELLEVQDDDKIIVIQNGEAKLISKANAKFGGGTVTLFYTDPNEEPSSMKRLVDVNGDSISAQAAYDAAMSGPVYIASHEDVGPSNETIQETRTMEGFVFRRRDGAIVTVLGDIGPKSYYAGEKPFN